jgi:hypothetical protein
VEGFSQERRGLFDGLKVPHNGNAVLIGAVGLLVYWLGILAIEWSLGVEGVGTCRLLAGMLGNLCSSFGVVGRTVARHGGWSAEWTPYPGVVWLAFCAWTVAVWAFLAGSITRIAAMKLAREEGLELKDAVRFGFKKWLSNVGSIVFVLIIIGFFFLVTNATLAGWLGRIPAVGGVLLGIFFGLVLVASFLIVLAAALGALGFNLAAAAISTEVSDAFDGVSRAWDYVLARPWHLILTYLSTMIYLAIVVFLGLAFIRVSVDSLSVGWWGLGETPRKVAVPDDVRTAQRIPPGVEYVYIPGRAEFIEGYAIDRRFQTHGDVEEIYYRQGIDYAIEQYAHDVGLYPPNLEALVQRPADIAAWRGPYLSGLSELPRDEWNRTWAYKTPGDVGKRYELYSLGRDAGPEATGDNVRNQNYAGIGVGHGAEINVQPLIEPTLQFAASAIKFWINLARLLLYGYCIAYFLSAQTTVYFLLRKEVEGEDYTEIVLEDEADEPDEPFEYGAPPPAAPDKPPAPPTTPTA